MLFLLVLTLKENNTLHYSTERSAMSESTIEAITQDGFKVVHIPEILASNMKESVRGNPKAKREAQKNFMGFLTKARRQHGDDTRFVLPEDARLLFSFPGDFPKLDLRNLHVRGGSITFWRGNDKPEFNVDLSGGVFEATKITPTSGKYNFDHAVIRNAYGNPHATGSAEFAPYNFFDNSSSKLNISLRDATLENVHFKDPQHEVEKIDLTGARGTNVKGFGPPIKLTGVQSSGLESGEVMLPPPGPTRHYPQVWGNNAPEKLPPSTNPEIERIAALSRAQQYMTPEQIRTLSKIECENLIKGGSEQYRPLSSEEQKNLAALGALGGAVLGGPGGLVAGVTAAAVGIPVINHSTKGQCIDDVARLLSEKNSSVGLTQKADEYRAQFLPKAPASDGKAKAK